MRMANILGSSMHSRVFIKLLLEKNIFDLVVRSELKPNYKIWRPCDHNIIRLNRLDKQCSVLVLRAEM